MGMPDLGLFAFRTSHQLQNYVNWRPDPQASATDALQQNWTYRFPYAFPPFCLVGQCLRKAIRHQNQMILVAPVWVSQPWYPMLLGMSIQEPILLPNEETLLKNPKGECHPLLLNAPLRLGAWLVPGKTRQQRIFQQQLPYSSLEPGQRELDQVTTRVGESLHAGVVNGRSILFHVI